MRFAYRRHAFSSVCHNRSDTTARFYGTRENFALVVALQDCSFGLFHDSALPLILLQTPHERSGKARSTLRTCAKARRFFVASVAMMLLF